MDGYLETNKWYFFSPISSNPSSLRPKHLRVHLLLYKIILLAGILADVEQARGLQRFAQRQILVSRWTLDSGALLKLLYIPCGQGQAHAGHRSTSCALHHRIGVVRPIPPRRTVPIVPLAVIGRPLAKNRISIQIFEKIQLSSWRSGSVFFYPEWISNRRTWSRQFRKCRRYCEGPFSSVISCPRSTLATYPHRRWPNSMDLHRRLLTGSVTSRWCESIACWFFQGLLASATTRDRFPWRHLIHGQIGSFFFFSSLSFSFLLVILLQRRVTLDLFFNFFFFFLF